MCSNLGCQVVAQQLANSFSMLWDEDSDHNSQERETPLNTNTTPPSAAQLNELRVVPHCAQQRQFGHSLYSQLQVCRFCPGTPYKFLVCICCRRQNTKPGSAHRIISQPPNCTEHFVRSFKSESKHSFIREVLLRQGAERGVDVRLVLPGYVTDHPMVPAPLISSVRTSE